MPLCPASCPCTPPPSHRPLPPSLASFMASEGHHWLRTNGSAVDFAYDSGRLTRTDTGEGGGEGRGTA
jgi:hypothetical protein